jgi:hypothetical protein
VKFQNEKIKRIFSIIKTWFQGENLKCRNKMFFPKNKASKEILKRKVGELTPKKTP